MKGAFAFVIVLLVPAFVKSSAYSKFKNPDDAKGFRMKKVQMVWEKAQKMLSKHQLADLYADLLVHDKTEKRLKKLKSVSEDEDGMIEAETREAFIDIVEKHGLDRYFPTDRLPGRTGRMGTGIRKDVELKDGKLKQLWKSAELEGFTDDEMETLREEFSHHQMKMEEFETMKDQYRKLQEKADNSLEELDKEDGHWRELDRTNKAMKEKFKEIRENMKTLEDRTANPDKKSVFKDPRVYQLWTLAKKSNMSAADLESFKEELTHFAHRIKKHEYVREQIASRPRSNSIEPERDTKHVRLQEQEELYKMKVDKYHADLTDKVKKALKHTEL